MRLKGFITEHNRGSRGKAISKDETIKLLETKCKKSLQLWKSGKKSLYRGMVFKGDHYLIDPSTSVRTSQNTANYYTLIMDNDKSWSGFPKRSKSIICTTSLDKAHGYGIEYHVFAYDGANYGVLPENDLWFSFKMLGNTPSGLINTELNGIASFFRVDGLPLVTKWSDFKKKLADIADQLPEMMSRFDNAELPWDLQNHIINYWDNDGRKRFDKWFINKWNPKDNNIYHTKDLNKVLSNKDSEIWTDSKSILITQDGMSELFKS